MGSFLGPSAPIRFVLPCLVQGWPDGRSLVVKPSRGASCLPERGSGWGSGQGMARSHRNSSASAKQGDVLRFVSSAVSRGKREEMAGAGGAWGQSAPSPGAGSSLDACGELPTQHQECGGAWSSCAVPAPLEQTLRGQKGNPGPSSQERRVERSEIRLFFTENIAAWKKAQ